MIRQTLLSCIYIDDIFIYYFHYSLMATTAEPYHFIYVDIAYIIITPEPLRRQTPRHIYIYIFHIIQRQLRSDSHCHWGIIRAIEATLISASRLLDERASRDATRPVAAIYFI